ncbi:MAG: phosphotransferase family protein [Rhodospirillales bacterium]|nr:MAG: phosphotransferase family protein [Rhodospirillales bacterium]
MSDTANLGSASGLTADGRDLSGLERFLREHVDGFHGPIDRVERMNGGTSNPTYLVGAGGARYALRRKPYGKLLPSAHQVDREYRVISALKGTGVPVPEALALCRDDDVIGSAFYVMRFVDGRVLWNQSLPGMAPAERASIWDELNRAQAALHDVDPRAVGLEDFARPGNYVARQVDRWSKQYRASQTHDIPEMDRLIEWLPGNVPKDARTAIVHGDYRMDNAIFDAREPRLLALLDWELATLGDPLADFAYQCLSWRTPPDPKGRGLLGLDLAGTGIPTEAEFVRAYCRRMNVDSLPHWDFYMAYNLFRVAAIGQGVYKRALDGVYDTGSRNEDQAERVRIRAVLGWQAVERMLAGA